MFTTLRLQRTAAALAAALLLGLFAGCAEQGLNAPDPNPQPQDQAPALPDADRLGIDLSFFQDGQDKAIGQQNFFNAYLRAVIVSATTQLVLTPPVAAFALALHTVPTLQPDGSWIWVYTYVRGDEEAQVRLRGVIRGDEVAWALRVTVPNEGIANELWFDGTTRDDGDTGDWTFYDFSLPGDPAAASVHWQDDADGHELALEVLHGPDAGDSLTFTEAGALNRIDYVDAGADGVWFIRWNESDGTGSLRVPDYRNGQESCWDEAQFDVDCGGS
ncbi:MAG: hypothetical protein IPI34_14680 [bacterium]|nr:hypothetical protein [bacterium]